MPNPIKGFQTKDGVRKYDYNELENLPETNPDDLAEQIDDLKSDLSTLAGCEFITFTNGK